MFWPLKFSTLDALQRLNIAIEKKLRQLLLAVGALLKLSFGDRGRLPEVPISVQYLMNFVLDLSLQIQFFQKFGYRFLNFMGCGLTVTHQWLRVLPVRLDEFILQWLLYLPEDVAVPHVFEYELALFCACETHVLLLSFAHTGTAIALLKRVVHSFVINWF